MKLRPLALLCLSGAMAIAAGCGQLLGLEDGKVQGVCAARDDCAPGFACVSGECRAACARDDDCGGSLRCSNGYCTINSEPLLPHGGGGAGGEPSGGGAGSGSVSIVECEPDAQRCSPSEPLLRELCVDGAFRPAAEPCPYLCQAGECRGECEEDGRRCFEGTPQRCQDATWQSEAPCAALCRGGECVNPPSCSALSATCAGNESCCRSAELPGGEFKRTYDGVSEGLLDDTFDATIGPFFLDEFEVTVGRFRAFRDAYPASKPASGAGKHPRIEGDAGWSDAYLLPVDRAALDLSLACADGTWTTELGPNEQRPINCLTFPLAYAFCIWDGGRLPTEAEWNYAAAGGGQQRVYPWSDPPSAAEISSLDAVYEQTAGLPAEVGSRSPRGEARWGQLDLAGNVWEWTLDWFVEPYATKTCVDCANLTPSEERVVRGGAYLLPAVALLSGFRSTAPPDYADATLGVRCARDL